MLVISARRGQHRALMQIDLTARELAMLDFEREWWRFEGRKEDQIRARFGLSPSSYYRALQALIELDAASATTRSPCNGCAASASSADACASKAAGPIPGPGKQQPVRRRGRMTG